MQKKEYLTVDQLTEEIIRVFRYETNFYSSMASYAIKNHSLEYLADLKEYLYQQLVPYMDGKVDVQVVLPFAKDKIQSYNERSMVRESKRKEMEDYLAKILATPDEVYIQALESKKTKQELRLLAKQLKYSFVSKP